MASNRQEIKKDIQYRILVAVENNPNVTTRELSKMLGISNGSAYYCTKALISKGLVKFENFSASKNKSKYTYYLTPKGIVEKSKLTANFLARKILEYKQIKEELETLIENSESTSREKKSEYLKALK